MPIDYQYVYGDGHEETITITINKSYARTILCLDTFDIRWQGGTPTDTERAELEEGIASVTSALNGA